MRQIELSSFGLENLRMVDAPMPEAGPGEVLVRLDAAALNPRDTQIATGGFSPNVPFPLVPLSDGSGIVEAVGEGVTRCAVGDRVASMFFPKWLRGEATAGERSETLGLELPGLAREYGVFPEQAVVPMPRHLSAQEAACYPCAGLTAWTSLVEKSQITAGDWVVLQGTGGVASMGLQLTKGLGARAIVLSSSNEKLAQARELGADHTINYSETPEWGAEAFEVAGHGVDAVLEIGGTGTMPQSLEAIRHGGHVNVIGYMAGIDMGITVFPLIIKNANIHGIGAGHRDGFEAMMKLVAEKQLRPTVAGAFDLAEISEAFELMNSGSPFGKVLVTI